MQEVGNETIAPMSGGIWGQYALPGAFPRGKIGGECAVYVMGNRWKSLPDRTFHPPKT